MPAWLLMGLEHVIVAIAKTCRQLTANPIINYFFKLILCGIPRE
jgi:hypothetical protein